MIAEVVFDLPLRHSFAYAVPGGMELRRGQRVSAPLRRRSRIGMVVETRYGDEHGLERVERAVDSVPVLSGAALELGRWAADESLSSWGSTLLALLPPAGRSADIVAPPPEPRVVHAPLPELWVGARRDGQLIKHLGHGGSALVIAPDRDAAARWAQRLDAVRLDSGASDGARRANWFAAARGRARVVVGTRSALLAPLPPPATLVLLDEHDAAHKPPGAPRLHSRDLLMRRAALDGSRLLLLSATPSVETWWRAQNQEAIRPSPEAEPWPEIITADTRGILRNHPLTLPLTRAIEHATRRSRAVAIVVSGRAASLICGECGALVRCTDCGVPLTFARAAKTLSCRLCARAEPASDHCLTCGGHRLSPLGWDAERVEAAVRRRFPTLTVSRTDPRVQVLIGTAAVLKMRAAGSLGAVGIVSMDSVLGVPDFRGGERAFELAWAAAEAVGSAGRVVIQTLYPDHYAIQAVKAHDLLPYYERELKFRAELGYPPFRRLCVITARGRTDSEAHSLATDCHAALREIAGLVVYPPAPLGASGARSTRWRLVVKGPTELPRLIASPLSPFLERRRRSGGMLEIEVDPV
jgi:primosomal protein N' (replication factor Y)